MWEAIERNRRRSNVLIGLMGALLVGLGFAIGMLVDPRLGGPIGAGVALAVWLILLLVALAGGDRVLLYSAGAHRVREKADAPQLWNVVEEMTIASGLAKMPALYVIDNEAPNAFAVGRKVETAAVAVTTGLLRRLSRDELQGVIAHEIAHIQNLDVRFMTLAAVMVGAIVLISDGFLRFLWFGGGRRRSSGRGGGQAQIIILLVGIALAILAPLFARMLYFACSRRREYLADASAARFTRYPDGLASALEKIAVGARAKQKVNRAVAPLYIINPLQGAAAVSWFATHPPLESRVQILRSMGGRAGYVDYEAAYKKLHGAADRLIGAPTLRADKSIPARAAASEVNRKQETIARVREVTDLVNGLWNYVFITCACGVRIKVPPEWKRETVPCPRCGRKHLVPKAVPATAPAGAPAAVGASGQGNGPEPAPLHYERKTSGWASFKCSCGKTVQLSPSFAAPFVQCRHCKREIEIS